MPLNLNQVTDFGQNYNTYYNSLFFMLDVVIFLSLLLSNACIWGAYVYVSSASALAVINFLVGLALLIYMTIIFAKQETRIPEQFKQCSFPLGLYFVCGFILFITSLVVLGDSDDNGALIIAGLFSLESSFIFFYLTFLSYGSASGNIKFVLKNKSVKPGSTNNANGKPV